MTFVCAVYFFCNRIMGKFCYISVAVSAGNVSVRSVCVYIFINIIALFYTHGNVLKEVARIRDVSIPAVHKMRKKILNSLADCLNAKKVVL